MRPRDQEQGVGGSGDNDDDVRIGLGPKSVRWAWPLFFRIEFLESRSKATTTTTTKTSEKATERERENGFEASQVFGLGVESRLPDRFAFYLFAFRIHLCSLFFCCARRISSQLSDSATKAKSLELEPLCCSVAIRSPTRALCSSRRRFALRVFASVRAPEFDEFPRYDASLQIEIGKKFLCSV